MRLISNYRRRARGVLVVFLFAFALVSCGGDSKSSTPTIVPPVSASPAAIGPVTTVGALADRVAAAWAGVLSYRATFMTQGYVLSDGVNGTATPAPESVSIAVTDEVLLPATRHRTNRVNGQVTGELIVSGGMIFVSGSNVPQGMATPAAGGWITIDPATLPDDSPYRMPFSDLLLPATPLYSGLSENERARSATPIGDETVEGRQCTNYRIADTTSTGDRIEVILSIDSAGLPCAIKTTSSDTENLTAFAYNVPVVVTAPPVATPVA